MSCLAFLGLLYWLKQEGVNAVTNHTHSVNRVALIHHSGSHVLRNCDIMVRDTSMFAKGVVRNVSVSNNR